MANTSAFWSYKHICVMHNVISIGTYQHVKEYYLCGKETAIEAAFLMRNWASRDRVVCYSIDIKAFVTPARKL